jgi:hypothetical protein
MPSQPPNSERRSRVTPYPQPQQSPSTRGNSLQVPRTTSGKQRSFSRSPSFGRSPLSSPVHSSPVPSDDNRSDIDDDHRHTTVSIGSATKSSKSLRIRSYNVLKDPQLRAACRDISQVVMDYTIYECPFFSTTDDWQNAINKMWSEVIANLGHDHLPYTPQVDTLVWLDRYHSYICCIYGDIHRLDRLIITSKAIWFREQKRI